MSKNISIQENGVAQTLNTISVVETKGSPSGSVDWVPEDECQLGQIVVRSNGEVTASDEGYYAFSRVTVNVPAEECKAVGMNEDGDWEVWGVDEDGELVELGLPTRIEVVTPPNKTSYIVGEPINTKGMVVMAYFEDDSEYGIISREEITLDPIVAPVPTGEGKTSDLDTELPQPIPVGKCLFSGTFTRDSDGTEFKLTMTTNDNDVVGAVIYQPNEAVTLFIASPHQGSEVTAVSEWTYLGQKYTDTREFPVSGSFTYNGHTVYHNGNVPNAGISMYADHATPKYPLPYIYPETTFYGNGEDAWTMVYGDIEGDEVTVKWPRTGDGQELTDTFDINVIDPTPNI